MQPYKVVTWTRSLRHTAKDADGFWFGDCYGGLFFDVDKDLIKNALADWADLLKNKCKNSFALAGDPRASNQAIQGVYAIGLG